MSKYLAACLVVAGVVSGQDYSSPGSTTQAADTTTSTFPPPLLPITTSTSTLATAPDSSITDLSTLSYTTEIFYYCTTPTFSAIGPFVTIYNTVYVDVCPTGGLTQVTYTITDTCGCTAATDYTRPTGCPSGFTTTEKTCTMCPGSPIITCTTPIITLASETSNPTNAAPVGNNAGSQNPENPTYTQPGPTPSSAPATKPSYATTNNAKPAAGGSSLGLLLAINMAVVAGLICVLS